MNIFLGRFLALLPWYKPYLPTEKPKSFHDVAGIAPSSPGEQRRIREEEVARMGMARIAPNSPKATGWKVVYKRIAASTTTTYTWNAKATQRNRRCRVCCLFVGAKATECWRGHAL